RDVQLGEAVVVQVGEERSAGAGGDAQRLLPAETELTLAVAAKEEVRPGAVLVESGDVEVEPAVAVHIAPARGGSLDAVQAGEQPRLLTDVAEDEGSAGGRRLLLGRSRAGRRGGGQGNQGQGHEEAAG